jgi:hypothetical protein
MDRQTPEARERRIDEFANGLPFHEGPLQEVGEENGIFIEDLLHAAAERLRAHNQTEFRCRENSLAITHIEEALNWLTARTLRREAAGVEGTSERMEGEG